MIRRFALPSVALCLAAALTGLVAPAAHAGTTSTTKQSVSCTGNTTTGVSPTAVTVTGSATCSGLATLTLTTTTNTGGLLSTVTSPLTALPQLPLPISTTIPAVGVSSACSVLADGGVTVSTSCSATG
jgi:hypothetical protein